MNKFEQFFFNKDKDHLVWKFPRYLNVYERHFAKFQGKHPNILEIGVFQGGSIEMWNDYFDDDCEIVGVDINPACKILEKDFENLSIHIGDQANAKFWQTLKQTAPRFDIIIDDGSHYTNGQICTFREMYDHMTDEGVYLCEDTHTSYKAMYRQGSKTSFIAEMKEQINNLHGLHYVKEKRKALPGFYREDGSQFPEVTNSIHFYDGIVVLERQERQLPKGAMRQGPDNPDIKMPPKK